MSDQNCDSSAREIIWRLVKEEASNTVMTRRSLHEYPELAYEEKKTALLVASRLREYGLDEVTTEVGHTGVVGVLKGRNGASSPCIMLRADMDALPIQELNNVSYRSKVDGKMHACGHDGHTAMLLSAAKILCGLRDHINGCVKFVFQPAEEGQAGAVKMIEAGVLENPRVDQVYGIHLWSYMKSGVLGIEEGAVMANSDRFYVTVHGKGGHGSAPETAVDALVCSANIVTALQTIPARNVSPLDNCVVTVGTMQGGYAPNVICDTCKLSGTVRTLRAETQDLVEERLKRICHSIAEAHGATADVQYERIYGATINTEKETEAVRSAARLVVDEECIQPPYRSLAGEDFSFFLRERPGCFYFVGCAIPDREIVGHHAPNFDIHEDALHVGAAAHVAIALQQLGGISSLTQH